ncbi:hypothetical protein [Priestia aryabhattai]|uniref:hypothetical protein n=1 Tax=Priestia aryabhattai TaxID=412384 RepID=UPI0015F4FD04|nr:hypothetical protein [Priestia aryabhattai]
MNVGFICAGFLAVDWKAKRRLLRETGTGETPRRGGSSAAPGKRSLVRKLTALAYLSNLFVFTLD